jgi:hypothetical protein
MYDVIDSFQPNQFLQDHLPPCLHDVICGSPKSTALGKIAMDPRTEEVGHIYEWAMDVLMAWRPHAMFDRA